MSICLQPSQIWTLRPPYRWNSNHCLQTPLIRIKKLWKFFCFLELGRRAEPISRKKNTCLQILHCIVPAHQRLRNRAWTQLASPLCRNGSSPSLILVQRRHSVRFHPTRMPQTRRTLTPTRAEDIRPAQARDIQTILASRVRARGRT